MFRRILLSAAVCFPLAIFAGASRADDAAPPASPWPVTINLSEGQLTVFQQQLMTYENGNVITSRAAISLTPPNQDQPVFGVAYLREHVNTDPNAGTVQIADMTVTSCHFPQGTSVNPDEITSGLQSLPQQLPPLQLADVQKFATDAQQAQTAENQLQTSAPTIVFVQHPAVKVQYDGQPRLRQTPGGLYKVMNTPFFVALDPDSKTYYLKGGGVWFSAPDALGPYSLADSIPESVVNLAINNGYTDPQQPIPPDQAQNIQIVTATEPTELISTDGPPQLQTIPGTSLLYWANTESDFFISVDNQQKYVLLSGRWFTAPDQNGPWTYISADQLPPDFKQIPPDSPKADVLASVPGTQAADDAVADADIPQATAVDATDYDQPAIQYDGDPNFEPVDGDPGVSYAVNTPDQVLSVNGRYYCCYNAVWYQSDQPNANWNICDYVPPEIYDIPPSCPDYSCRFVYIYGHRGSVVWVGYTSGYLGVYAVHGVVVYGTGYHYKPWSGRRYFGRPATYGYAARINTGGVSFAVGNVRGGGTSWVGHAPGNRPDPRDRWFGAAGFQARQAHAVVAVHGRPQPEVRPARLNLYQRRTDVHPEVLTHPELAAHGKLPPLPGRKNVHRAAPQEKGPPPPPAKENHQAPYQETDKNSNQRHGPNYENSSPPPPPAKENHKKAQENSSPPPPPPAPQNDKEKHKKSEENPQAQTPPPPPPSEHQAPQKAGPPSQTPPNGNQNQNKNKNKKKKPQQNQNQNQNQNQGQGQGQQG